jgi:iron(III) transport system permease protein
MLQQSGIETEEASINLGVPPGRTFWRITVPIVMPGIISGSLLTWATVTRELNATILLYGPGTTTLPIQVFLEVLQGKFGRASALGTVLMAMTFIPVLILFRYLGKDEEILL